MNRKSDPSVYCDSCIYLAHYRQESVSYGVTRIAAIKDLFEENSKGGTTIVTSSLAICEVESKLLESQMVAEIEDFKNLFRLGLHKMIDIDPIISSKAAHYRDFYRKNPVKRPNGEKLTNLASPDALHLATAVVYKCDEFWTLDGLDPKADKHKSIKPLWLGNAVGNDQLIIVPPSRPQATLPLFVTPSAQPPIAGEASSEAG